MVCLYDSLGMTPVRSCNSLKVAQACAAGLLSRGSDDQVSRYLHRVCHMLKLSTVCASSKVAIVTFRDGAPVEIQTVGESQ